MQHKDERYGPWISVSEEQSETMRRKAAEVRDAEREVERGKLQLRRAMLAVDEKRNVLFDLMSKTVGEDRCVEFEPDYRRYHIHLDCVHGTEPPQPPAWVADILKEIAEGGKST